jgi:hypothetical protein
MSNSNKIPTEIKTEEILNALKRSGYLIEQRVFPIFGRLGYYLETNCVYEDPELKKSREIDFKASQILDDNGVEIQYILFGECKNNPFPIIFFSSNVIADLVYREFTLKYIGLPMDYPNEKNEQGPFIINNRIPLSRLLKLNSFHHYFKENPCTQYCSFQYKKDLKEWMAFHDPDHHDDFNKLINSLKYEKDRNFFNPPKDAENKKNIPLKNIIFYYPVIVYAGDLFVCNQIINNVPVLEKTNHIKYKKQAIVSENEDNYFIDVIKESYLENYLKMIHEEHSRILNEITKNFDLIQRTIETEKPKVKAYESKFGKALEKF